MSFSFTSKRYLRISVYIDISNKIYERMRSVVKSRLFENTERKKTHCKDTVVGTERTVLGCVSRLQYLPNVSS